jgi:hypothetical protein
MILQIVEYETWGLLNAFYPVIVARFQNVIFEIDTNRFK